MKVGWIGLGKMGEPFALQALKGGHELTGHSRGGKPRPAMTAAGAKISDSLEETVRGAAFVGACLFDDAQVKSVLVESGVLQAMEPGAVLAVHTTGVPAVIEAVAAAAPPGVAVLDATFSGTEADAREGRIRLYVGGDAEALDRARPVLSTYCSPIFHLGAIGAARRLKLINNMMFAAQIALAAEGLKAVDRMGLPKDAALDALSQSSGGSYALNTFRGGDVDAIVARLAHYLDKDVDAARQSARSEGLNLELLDAAAARWTLPKA